VWVNDEIQGDDDHMLSFCERQFQKRALVLIGRTATNRHLSPISNDKSSRTIATETRVLVTGVV